MKISQTRTDASDEIAVPQDGMLDIHAHLLPDIDDGSRSFDETVALIQKLRKAGYTGSVCTPHIWPQLFPNNIPDRIADLVAGLRGHLADHGIDYTLWDGGELRLFEDVVPWMKDYGVPTLGPSRAVLCDFWEPTWPAFVDSSLQWLLEAGYTPILAHPERIPIAGDIDEHLDRIQGWGVRLQGNLRCLTGRESAQSRLRAQAYLKEGRYSILALDVHRIENLQERLEGLRDAEAIVDRQDVVALTVDAPRRLLACSDPDPSAVE
ncbi:tyrosine-protein phosphatase [Mucisphaera sp.]|uniref:tyrosine-protein phosphatase n=1 Tax=Mucisphaera sp. TaxID=2913024 RepID=UPI003D0B7ED3